VDTGNRKVQKQDFQKRTMEFGLRVVHLVETLPKTQTAQVLGRQLLRSGTSVGANYRSAVRGKSRADFIAKMEIVEEECDEAIYWMEMLIEAGLVRRESLRDLVDEANQIVAITVSSIKTARARK
jgi:four helix bundle protein